MAIGFIGTGAITEAIVVGLYSVGAYAEPILLSKRSEKRSSMLADRFPLIEVVDDNQTIVDRCDEVFVSVLPEQAAEVLSTLQFSAHHRVMSLVAGLSLDDVAVAVAPATQCFRAIPMPPIEFGLGPTSLCPPDEKFEALFNRVGNAVPVEDEMLFSAFASSSAGMAAFFDLVANIADWMEQEGIAAEQSALYTTSLVHALASLTTKVDPVNLQKMSEACLTPGGLNEQVLHGCRREGWTEIFRNQMDEIMLRLS